MHMKKLAVLLMLCAPSAYAHPGEHHGDWLAAITHLLTQPDHLAMLLIAVLVGVGGAVYYYQRKRH